MTAPTPEKIQRWEPQVGFRDELQFGDSTSDGREYVVEFRPHERGKYVTHSDHLRHLKLAQIEILESLINRFAVRSCACSIQMEAEVAALRKEIEG